MLYCPNFFWNVLQVWMTGKDVYLQMTWSWPDKTWNILCSYCLQWNTSQSKFRNHYFLFLFAFSILSQLFLIWGCIYTNTIGKSEIIKIFFNVFAISLSYAHKGCIFWGGYYSNSEILKFYFTWKYNVLLWCKAKYLAAKHTAISDLVLKKHFLLSMLKTVFAA